MYFMGGMLYYDEGIAASKGYAIGKAFIKKDIKIEINKSKIDDVESEIKN